MSVIDQKGPIIDLSNKKRLAAQIGGAVGFSTGYAALEALVLEDYLRQLGLTEGIAGSDVYPYHLFAMLPTFAGIALLIGHDKRLRENVLNGGAWARTVVNGVQVFFPLVIMEDVMYFVLRGFDPRHVDTYGIHNIRPGDWTCFHAGCVDAGFTQVPVWYIATGAIAAGAWLVDNVVFRQKK